MRTLTRARPPLVLGSALLLTLTLSVTACGSGTPTSPDAVETPDAAVSPAAEAEAGLTLMVPSEPGTGWDETGRTLQTVLADGLVENGVDIVNYRGADGTVGLTQLVGEADPSSLLVLGDVLVGAVELAHASATLDDVTPIARLAEEPLAVVVTADSPYRTVQDLVDDITANGQDVPVTGGPAGGADHVLAARVLLASGMPAATVPTQLKYVPWTDGESFDALFDGTVRAAVADVSEYADLLEAGSLRALAVSGAERSAALPDVPTLQEQGIDVVLTGWRGVAAAGVDATRATELTEILTRAHDAPAWRSALSEQGWSDAFLTGPELDAFLEAEVASVRQLFLDLGLTS